MQAVSFSIPTTERCKPVSSSERKRARSAASGSERQKILARARASEGALERARASGEDNLMGNKQLAMLVTKAFSDIDHPSPTNLQPPSA